jgi:hypothetical protein
MRVRSYVCCLAPWIVGLTLQAQTAAPPPTATPSQDGQTVMTAAHEALGGDKRIAAIKTIVATGRTRQVQGDNLVPIEFEIDIELPDKYVRTDEIPARESGPTRRGFNGSAVIQPPAAPGRAGGPAVDPAVSLHQDFARLTLGMFATSFSTYPLTFTYAGAAEAPEGKADVIDVKGPDNFAARLFINNQTHIPLMLSWTAPSGPARGTPAPAAPAETRLYFADYRDVDGLKLPFRIRRANGATTVEETTFDRFRINAKIDPKKFEAR